MKKLLKSPQKVDKLTKLKELISNMKVVYSFYPDSKLFETQRESFEKEYKIEYILTSNDSSMLDWLYEKAGGEFKKGPDNIIYLSFQFN